jgi:hypothetical protein
LVTWVTARQAACHGSALVGVLPVL